MSNTITPRWMLLLFFFIEAGVSFHAQTMLQIPKAIALPSSTPNIKIYKILKGTDGFMWIATSEGLKRFDGQRFESFHNHGINDFEDKDRNTIFDLLPDGKNKIWVATNAGLFSYDIKNNHFQQFEHPDLKPKTTPIRNLTYLDDSTLILSASGKGIYFFNKTKHTLKHLYFSPPSKNTPFNDPKKINTVSLVQRDARSDSIYWLGTHCGLIRLNIKNYSYRLFINHTHTKEELIAKSNIVIALYQYNDTTLLLGSWGGGLLTFDTKSKRFKTYMVKDSKGILATTIHAFMPLDNHRVYCLTGKDNLVFDTYTKQKTKDVVLPPELEATCSPYFEDNAKRYWGSFGHYLGLIDPLSNQFTEYPIIRDYKGGDMRCNFVCEYKGSDELLVTADEAPGVYILNRKTNKWRNITLPDDKIQKNIEFRSYGATKTPDGEWIILDYLGLYTISDDEKKLEPFRIRLPFTDASYRCIMQDSEGYIWIGSHNRGLFRVSLKSQEVTVFYDELFEEGGIKAGTGIWSLFEDSRHNIWIRRSSGYSIYEREKGIFHNILFDKMPDKTYSSVSGFFEDNQGRVWIMGTKGLGYTDPDALQKGIIKKITPPAFKGRLPYNPIRHRDYIWMYCNGQIHIFSPDSEKIVKTIDPHYGYGTKEIFRFSKLSTGEICIGNRGGIKIFHPDSLAYNPEVPRPYIAAFKINDTLSQERSGLTGITPQRLSHTENTLAFRISALAFSFAEQVRFKVKMEGADKEWYEPAPNQRIISYFHLPPGQYRFLVKAANNEGMWSEPYVLPIRIIPPFWHTYWFYALITAAVAAIIYTIFRRQLYRKMIEQQAIQLREKDELKTKLYTNITHEFRTPLTVIEGMAEEIAQYPQINLSKKVKLIKKNSRQLLHLVNQMLELNKLEAKKASCNYVQDDIIRFLAYLVDSFSSFANRHQINLQFYSESPSVVMDFDPEIIRKIMTNLLSNALKFTREYGKVLVVAKLEDGHLLIKVIDSGIGIAEKDLPHVFSRFFRVDESGHTLGSGIGLAITKELTHALSGTISVESKLGRGSTFLLQLPIENKAQPSAVQLERSLKNSTMPEDKIVASDTISSFFKTNDKPIVLIVEDNADLVYYLKSCLDESFNIFVSRDGVEGIESALAIIPDIIISDVMMPQKDGFQLCKTIKNDMRTSHIPIILLTAKTDEESKLTGLKRGADAYMKKPFSKRELLLRINKLIELRRKLKDKYTHFDANLPATGKTAAKEEEFIQKLNSILLRHLGDFDFSIPFLCKKMALSRTQLHRKIKALTGHSASIYLRKFRLHQAYRLLETTDKRISEIALDCGFENFSWFAQAFKEEFGMAASEVRK